MNAIQHCCSQSHNAVIIQCNNNKMTKMTAYVSRNKKRIYALQERRLTFTVEYSKDKQGSSSGCVSIFPVNLIPLTRH